MRRSTMVLLVIVGLVVVGLYLTGVGLGRRGQRPVSLDDFGEWTKARPLAPDDLADPGRCLEGSVLHVGNGSTCTLSADSTWSLQRRVLVLDSVGGMMTARVSPRGHVERTVDADLRPGRPNELPVDRAGARIIVVCFGPAPCVAEISTRERR